MGDNTIKSFLRKLNTGGGRNLIFKNSIGGNVEIAKVWVWRKGEFIYKDQDFFLIKNQIGKYVAAVYGINNFHWYTLYEERGKGYLSNALRNLIIPFLWGEGRHEIHDPFEISIGRGIGQKNFKASSRLAESVGFKKIEENDHKSKFRLEYDDFSHNELPVPKLTKVFDPESKARVIKKCQLLSDLFLEIRGELEIICGEKHLEDFDEMKYLKNKVEGIFEDFEFQIIKI